jgi:Acetyltransferase (GNAT) domain
MAWTLSWLQSWDAIWEPGHLARWQAAVAEPEAGAGAGVVHASPFMHPGVVRAWLESTGGPDAWAPFFLHARHADGQAVLWLLVRPRAQWRTGFVRRLVPAGADLFDYHDPVVIPVHAPGAVLAPGFWQALEVALRQHEGAWFDVCTLSRIRPACCSDGAFPTPGGSAPILRLDRYPGFDAYLASRRKTIAGLNRKWAKHAAEGLSFHAHHPSETEAVLGWLPDLEAARGARYPGSGLPPGYLARLVAAGHGQGLIRASTLTLDGRPISWDLSFYLNRVFYGYMRAFDAAFFRLSPGRLHSYRTIEWLYAEGAHTFDFLLGSEDYKSDWTDGEEITVRSRAIRSRALTTRSRQYARQGLGMLNLTHPAVPPVDGAAK